MPEISKDCDVYQGYNFKKDKQTRVGFITSLKVGTVVFTPDQTAKDPTAPTTDLVVVAVLSSVNWSVGSTDAVYFSGQVSTATKQNINMIKINDLGDIQVSFKFTTYEFDPLAKVYFKCFHSNEVEMLGLLEKTGDDLNIDVSEERAREVQSPENYSFSIGIKPMPQAQSLHVAVKSAANIVKQWGFLVTG